MATRTTKTERKHLAALVLDAGLSPKKVADMHQIPTKNLYNWIAAEKKARQLNEDSCPTSPPPVEARGPASEIAKLQRDIRTLKAALKLALEQEESCYST